MLTRLKVNGFKNLVDVDVRFGPFTCIAGANGIGKSNLFDAIRFLGALADRSLIDAARSVRGGRTADVKSLFHRVGDDFDNHMSFEAEMIVPEDGEDDLGQEAHASITFLRYKVELALRTDDSRSSLGGIEVIREELTHINLGEASRHLLFEPSLQWRKSAVKGRRTAPFISTEVGGSNRTEIRLHLDRGGASGKPSPFLASTLPRTVLSSANAAENRTAVLAKREMQSWKLLQLEPSALREPDDFIAPTQLGADGSHLASTLYHLARAGGLDVNSDVELSSTIAKENVDEHKVYDQIASRLAELIDDVREVGIDRDERRELLTLVAKGRDETSHPARALSDGTLRFLALAVIELDPKAQGVLCLEEPENGIHPKRIPAVLKLLRDIATDIDEPIGSDNPLRQVIVNTHSPAVVAQVPPESLIVAELKESRRGNQSFSRASFGYLADTWRQSRNADDVASVVPLGRLLSYLNPISPNGNYENSYASVRPLIKKPLRVVDRDDVKQLLLPQWNEVEDE